MKLTGKIAEEFEEHAEWARENLELALQTTREGMERCESPLEQTFLLTFLSLHGFTDNVYFEEETGLYRFFVEFQLDSFIAVIPQAPVRIDEHRFRVDFLISYKTRNPLLEHLAIVVEIDGHDFHERTKEQARRDRSRDRLMTREGYTVFRFTGSEVYARAGRCAQEVSSFIHAFERKLGERAD